MRKFGFGVTLAVICFTLILMFDYGEVDAAEKTVFFTDTHEVLHGNPYTGTAFDINTSPEGSKRFKFTDDPAITDFIKGAKKIPEDADIVRVHIAWADFEPKNNKWDWERIDQFLKRIREQGKQAEIQLLMSEGPDSANDSGVFPYEYPPAWLFDEVKAPYRMVSYNGGQNYIRQPLYYDKAFLTELEEAVSAFAKRYDGNKGIAWVDLRAFALFGEWSGWNDAFLFPWPDSETRTKTLRAIIDIYKEAFEKSIVMMPNAGAGVRKDDPDADTQEKRYTAFAYDYAAENPNWGFRSDTVNSAFNWMYYGTDSQASWNNRYLRRDHIQVSEGSSWNDPVNMLNNPRKVVQNAIEDYRTNLQGINNTGFRYWEDMKNAYGEWFTTLGRYSGYRLLMQKAVYNDELEAGGQLTMLQTWTNNGAGFSPKAYPLMVYLTNPNGKIVWSGIDKKLDQRKWFKGEFHDVLSTFQLPPKVRPGVYDLKIAFVDDAGKPVVAMPMENGVGRMYKIGSVKVTSMNGAEAATVDAAEAEAQAAVVSDASVVEEADTLAVEAADAEAASSGSPRFQFRVESEDYTRIGGGAYAYTFIPEGGFDTVYMESAGGWVEYNHIDVPQTGRYTVEFRVSSDEGNEFRLEVDGADALGTMKTPNSGGYQVYRTMERQLDLTAGRHTMKVVRGTTNSWFFINWMRFTSANPEEIKIQAETPTSQFGTWLQAEDAPDDDGTAGVSVIDTGDWLQYDQVQVPESGNYLLQMRYSTLAGAPAQKFKLLVDGVDATGELSLTDTGGLKKLVTSDFIVPLTAGIHSLKIEWTDAQSQLVWNWLKFNLQGDFSKTIEAEHYNMQWNLNKDDIWVGHDTGVIVGTYQDGGQEAEAVGDFDKDDYLRYENVYVPHTGFYRLDFRVASDEDQTFRFEVDGDLNLVEVPDTGGDGSFTTVTKWIKITEGIHHFRIVYESKPAGTGMLLDRFTLTAGTAVLKAIEPQGAAELNVGETTQVQADAVGMDGSRKPITSGAVFRSSDSTVAAVDANGLVTALKWGTTVLTVDFEGQSGSYTLTVSDPSVELTTINDTDPAITYVGNYGTDSNRPFGDYENDVHYLIDQGDYYEYAFEGTGIEIVTEKYLDMGNIDVYIDGELQATVDCTSPVRLAQQHVFRASGLEMGSHTIKVVHQTSGKIAILDALVVERPKT